MRKSIQQLLDNVDEVVESLLGTEVTQSDIYRCTLLFGTKEAPQRWHVGA